MTRPSWLNLFYGILEDIICFVFFYLIVHFAKISLHSSMNFYSKVSAILLCAGIMSRIALLSMDSVFRFQGNDIF